jgi:hypothetical protein
MIEPLVMVCTDKSSIRLYREVASLVEWTVMLVPLHRTFQGVWFYGGGGGGGGDEEDSHAR